VPQLENGDQTYWYTLATLLIYIVICGAVYSLQWFGVPRAYVWLTIFLIAIFAIAHFTIMAWKLPWTGNKRLSRPVASLLTVAAAICAAGFIIGIVDVVQAIW
jgi:hypothetical protein